MINASANPIFRVLAVRDFRLLWLGGSISMLGSQFSLVALPWLVLQLTGDPLALGIVLALGGIPRAGFILLGGAIADRFSPRTILVLCDWINFVLSALLALLVFTGLMQVWMLYVFSLITGLLAGFVMPAASSVLPVLVPENDLQPANSISMGTQQLTAFAGPALAGLIIGAYSKSVEGVAVAFTVDAITFAICAIMLGLMHGGGRVRAANEASEDILRSIRAGVTYLWGQTGLRFLFMAMAMINFFFTGPLLVGIPVLADQRLPEGAAAFGLLMSAYAGGNLAGFVVGGLLPKPSGRFLGALLVGSLFSFGLVLVCFGWITNTWIDLALILLVGIGNGYLGLVIFTWIQQRTPREMLGRVMSMVMFAGLGLVPLSQILAGAVSSWDLTGLFVLSGSVIVLAALWSVFQPALKSLAIEMAGD